MSEPNQCSCGAVYPSKRNLDAHIAAMEQRNESLPKTPGKDDVNRREVHGYVTAQ